MCDCHACRVPESKLLKNTHDWACNGWVRKGNTGRVEPCEQHSYTDSDGNRCSLDVLCRREPGWAANVIRTLKDCGQNVVCRTPPGCMRHWEERCRELVAERNALRDAAESEGAVIMRCLRCGCPPSVHIEPGARCAECECTAYEDPSPAARKAGA